MTNESGSDHPAHEEIHAQTESWPDNQLPEDDFADAQATDEAGMVSQEAEADSEDSAPPPTRSRSMFLPIGVAIVGMLFLGGVVYWQFGRSSAPPVSPMVMMAQTPLQQKKISSAPAVPKPSAGTDAQVSGANDRDAASLYKPGQESSYTPPTTPKTGMATIPESAPSNVSGSPSGVATPVSTAAPSIPPSSVPASSVQATAPATPSMAAEAPVVSPTAGVANTGAVDRRLETLTARIEDVQKQLNQVTNMVAANQAAPTPAPSSQAMSPAVEDRLNKIEQVLLALQHDEQTKASAVTAQPSAPASAIALTYEKPAVEKTVRTAPKKHKAEHKKPVVMAHKAKSVPVKGAEELAPHWILRAATPTEAWVSADPASSELRHLQIGDALPGIGRIQAIRQVGDGWIVQGTSGSVH